MRKLVFTLVTVIPGMLIGQDVPGSARVTVVSEPAGAEVYLDGRLAGTTPLHDAETTAGGHALTVAYPSLLSWNAHVKTDSIDVRAGEGIALAFEFGSVLHVHSTPPGATVTAGGRVLGSTPLYHRGAETLRGAMRISREGYEDLVVDAAAPSKMFHLKPIREPAHADMTVESSADRAGVRLATYVSAAGMVVSGVTAAYFKHKADGRFAQYASTGNPRDLNATKKYDNYSGIALILTEVSFGLLTYLLLSE